MGQEFHEAKHMRIISTRGCGGLGQEAHEFPTIRGIQREGTANQREGRIWQVNRTSLHEDESRGKVNLHVCQPEGRHGQPEGKPKLVRSDNRSIPQHICIGTIGPLDLRRELVSEGIS